MKKGIQITALTTLFTFLLMGTAIAHPAGDAMMQWYKPAGSVVSGSAYAADTQSMVHCMNLSQGQASDLWRYAHRFTRIRQVVEIAGYRANLTVSIQSMLQSAKDVGLAPTVTLEFIW